MTGAWASIDGPEKGSGSFSLTPDLDGKVLVRRNHADLPASNGRPAAKHDDLMVIYRDAGKAVKAIYFDNEGHVIEYMVTTTPDKKSLTFLSDVGISSPRFRLMYTKGEGDTMSISFAIAQPGKPNAFKTYVQGKVGRQAAKSAEK
jgi:hypothetical protein